MPRPKQPNRPGSLPPPKVLAWGACVENSTGRILCAYGNRVNGTLRSGEAFPLEPTNHGERQLVSWYYANAVKLRQTLGYLPKPSQLTVVPSFDPCAMCAGSLLTAGFNVAVIAPDDQGAGINWDSTFQFNNVPNKIRKLLLEKFGYYKVPGQPFQTVYHGGKQVIFSKDPVSLPTYQANIDPFNASIATIQDVLKNTAPTNTIMDPLTLDPGNP